MALNPTHVVNLTRSSSSSNQPTDNIFPTHSFPKSHIRIVLLENISQVAVKILKDEGFEVEYLTGTLSNEGLKEKLKDAHAVGIRSATNLTESILKECPRLLAIGCFCIGTNQVDLSAAEKLGIPVFNSPFSNSRSVAELIIAQIINLARQLGDKNREMHSGNWNKSAKGCREIRGKVLGIVGYGHIGAQLSVLAESMGMKVIFYDIIKIMPLGNSYQVDSLETLLSMSDFVTLHVPETEQTKNMISSKELSCMKKGSFLLNASRGTVVVIDDLVSALKSGHLGGAYVDVFPEEPRKGSESFYTPLAGLPNVLLTPHIGGSTEEAQEAIGDEVAKRLVSLINGGITDGAVNFPNLVLPYNGPTTHRILNTHKNVPGVLREINNILGDYNIENQVLKTKGEIGYLIVEVNREASKEIKKKIACIPASIKTRVLF